MLLFNMTTCPSESAAAAATDVATERLEWPYYSPNPELHMMNLLQFGAPIAALGCLTALSSSLGRPPWHQHGNVWPAKSHLE